MEILEQAPEHLFTITGITVAMPPKAKMEPSQRCDKCKEPTMASKLTQADGHFFCQSCMADIDLQ